ncbi:MAG: TatD family hydrolase [Deltaproteobacteria bacterium]|nr:TatD family hydrolase [Deltaproteobacteria bacterium]
METKTCSDASDNKKNDVILIDSHAHLELEPLVEQTQAVVARAVAAGLIGIITVGIDLQDAKVALGIAEQFDMVFAAAGFHPHNAKDVADNSLLQMEKLCENPKVVGYGEIGLDFFRNRSPRDLQLAAFSNQMELAQKIRKPIIVHLRDAYQEGLAMLEKHGPFPFGGVIHCFSGDESDARRALDLGFYISIPGTVTYKKNDKLRAIVATIPDDRILLETDCPFLSPEPLRGKDNEPSYIIHTARKVAEIRGVDLQSLGLLATQNAIRLFNLPL